MTSIERNRITAKINKLRRYSELVEYWDSLKRRGVEPYFAATLARCLENIRRAKAK